MNLPPRARNFIAVLSSNFGVQALRFLTLTVLARRLGQDFFGAYNYILLLVTYGTIITEFGLRNLGIREFSQNRGTPKLIKQILTIRLGHALVAVLAVEILTGLAFPDKGFLAPSLLIASSLFADALFVDFILVANEALVAQASGNLIQAGILLAGCFFFIHSPDHFLWLGAFYLLSHAAWAMTYFLTAKKFWPDVSSAAESGVTHAAEPATKIEGHTWRTAVNGAPFMVALLVNNFQTSMDLLLLGQFHYENILGTYSAALKIIGMAQGLVIALVAAVQPRLARESANMKSAEMKKLVAATTRFLWMFVAPTVIGCWLFGDPLVKWVFGASYEDAATFIKPLSLSFALLSLSMGPLTALMVSSQTKAMLKLVFLNGAISFLIIGGILFFKQPLLVPWGMVAAQGVFLATLWGWFGSAAIFTLEDLRVLAAPATLMTVALLAPLPAPLKFALAILAYVGGLLVQRVWRRPWFKMVLGS